MSLALAAHLDRPTAVYRFYDSGGQLLYVGITCNLPSRFRDHQATSPWWAEQRSVAVIWRDTRVEAVEEERAAIRDEKPRCNVAGTRLPRTRTRLSRPDPVAQKCIAAQVRGEVARAGRSKAEVRELLGLSRQSAWQRMRGEMPFRDEELLTLAEYLDVPVDRLLAPLPLGTYA